MRKIATRYKGIAIFGAPGSGKTTIATSLLHVFPAARHVEASSLAIKPAMALKGKLPQKEGDFIKTIGRIYKRPIENIIARNQARYFFSYLKNHYSSSVIAKTIIYIHRKELPKSLMIVAGIRGYQNAMYFKQNGYLVIYLTTPDKYLAKRISRRENFSTEEAEKERQAEEHIFSTKKIEKIAHASFDTSVTKKREIITQIQAMIEIVECKKCVNSTANPSISIGKSGLCELCEQYENNFDASLLKKELEFLTSFKKSGAGKYDAMVGISGGKDSTATLYEVKQMGFTPLAFSLDTGYYPKHIFTRAKQVARDLDVDYERINAKKYMRAVDRVCFQKAADLYSEHSSEELKKKFKKLYMEGRIHYSIKCQHAIPFVRTCQLCRRLIIRAYYGESLKHGVSVVILGINEWAGLSQNAKSKKFVFSAIRKLQPFKNKPPVYIIHLPFLLQRNIKDTEKVLKKLGWKIPHGERLIESNSNSCLFARAAENKARQMLGFHPDSTRLAREVTVGFITKKQARVALDKIHNYNRSVRQVLRDSGVI